ncbi:hypothetical protein GCM10023150_21740 [Kangiella taiwanensis]|uniref:SnoaL-like domain-containing protein n=2 Tax=Kangiella taiwanensis TaxID=1079179 RepID=A0ABP8I7Y8_9GAMM
MIKTFQWIMALLFICLASTNSKAAPKESGNDIELINTLFENYMAKYNHYLSHSEFNKEPDLYHDNVMIVSNSNGSNTLSSDNLYEQVKVFLDSLKAKGVHNVQWESTNIQILDTNLAVVSNIAVRYLINGDIHNKVGATYFVNKYKGEWKISAFSVHDYTNTL